MTAEVTDDDIMLWLVDGTDAEAQHAISCIFRMYGDKVVGYLNKQFPGLPLDDKDTVLSLICETLWHDGRKGKLDIGKSLPCLIFGLAYRRATDLFRYATRNKRTLPSEQYHQELSEAIHGSSLGSSWAILERRDLVRQVIADFHRWLGTLPPGQRAIAYVIADGFPDLRGPKDIYDIVIAAGREQPSYESVKRAYSVIMDKFKKSIESKYKEVWS